MRRGAQPRQTGGPTGGCPAVEVLQRFVAGRLPAAHHDQILDHIQRCPRCMDAVVVSTRSIPAESLGMQHTIGATPEGDTTPGGTIPLRTKAIWPSQIEEFRLLFPIGRGGMGEVYAAHDAVLDRIVAIKLLSSAEPDAAARERFLIEVRALARLQHPNIVTVFRAGEIQGRPYLVSELVRGRSLDRLPKPLPWREALRIAIDVAAGLAAVHRRGVLHRDIKPGNIVLTEDGTAKLLDFGLAKLLASPASAEPSASAVAAAGPSVTHPGTLLGTPLYMAPEQWEGGSATQRSDLYAVGAVLYELCAGRTPHRGTMAELRHAVRTTDSPAARLLTPDIPAALDELISRCLARDSTARPASADALAAALERIAAATAESDAGAASPLQTLVDDLEQVLRRRMMPDQSSVETQLLNERVDDLVPQIIARGRVNAGDVVAGARLSRPIGSGNFATVWLAQREPGGEAVATKVFHVEKLGQGLMLWRFRRGIKAMQRLTSTPGCPPSIVRISAVADHGLAFAMDYHAAGSLESSAGRGLTLAAKVELMAELCRSVGFAHAQGIVHRDIKPANVLLSSEGKPVLTDFDIADVRFLTTHSMDGSGGLGTPIFAAPEQLEDGERADERSDVYSLGRLLHFLLLERSPGMQMERDPSLPELAHLPAPLVEIVRRATQWSQDRRFPTAAAMRAELLRAQTSGAVMAARLARARRWARRNALALGLLATGAVGLGAFAVYKASRDEEVEASRRKAEMSRRVEESMRVTHDKDVEALAQLQRDYRTLLDSRKDLDSRRAELTKTVEALRTQLRGASALQRREIAKHAGEAEAELRDVEEKIADRNQRLASLLADLQARRGSGGRQAVLTDPSAVIDDLRGCVTMPGGESDEKAQAIWRENHDIKVRAGASGTIVAEGNGCINGRTTVYLLRLRDARSGSEYYLQVRESGLRLR